MFVIGMMIEVIILGFLILCWILCNGRYKETKSIFALVGLRTSIILTILVFLTMVWTIIQECVRS
jgi:hypothetical protein